MAATIHSATLFGIDALQVSIEVDVLPGLPSFTVVGLTDKAIQESRERLIAALSNSGFTPPRRKTIVSLAPASIKKEGSLYDVPIAIGYLLASGQLQAVAEDISSAWCVGELGLDGTARAVRGLLPIALAAKRQGIRQLFVPEGNAAEATIVADSVQVYPYSSLQALVGHMTGVDKITLLAPEVKEEHASSAAAIDMKDIAGHDMAKRALAICAAGGHNVLLVGPPGTGKTLLARALAGVLPPLIQEEALTVTSLYSVAGMLEENQGIVRQRPFRAPHHGASAVALIGGGTNPKPGEVSLAHHGVLFLDELPEFSRHVVEQLRQPLEDGWVTIARANASMRFPARFMLVAAMNPCPCGFIGSTRKECVCSPSEVLRYQRKISGPILDRIDVHILIQDVEAKDLMNHVPQGQTSQELAQEVATARTVQWERQGKTNAELTAPEMREHCALDEATEALLLQAQQRFALSSRGIHRVLRVARTVADMAGEQKIQTQHLMEALQYREQLKSALPDFV